MDKQKFTFDKTTLATQYQHAIEVMQPAIEALLTQYEEFGIPDTGVVNSNDLPQKQINEFIQNLDVYYPGANHIKLKLALRNHLQTLDCFNYRVIAKNRSNNATIAVWNPLEISLPQFKTQHAQDDIVYREAAESYPATDIISDWITQRLPENLYKE